MTRRDEFTLEELVTAAAAELTRLDITPADGRATNRPDARTLRYYTTIGLLDPPLERRHRRAIYGRRHLRQAVAVKTLQADGVPLADIQRRLAGIDDAALARIADDHAPMVAALAAAPPPPPTRARRAQFWSGRVPEPTRSPAPRSGTGSVRERISGVEVTPDVTVLVRGDSTWTTHPEVIAAMERLAAAIAETRTNESGDDHDHH
jgi:DNA-binding transcriptional MerR regulator